MGAVIDRPLLVVVGSGGVGKTTLAAALGLSAARAGRRTLVMTFDPSLRLKDALGVGERARDQEVPVRVDTPGRLDVSLLDARATFDRLVLEYSPDEAAARRILDNRFYRHLAGGLAGILEYMAVERLFEVTAARRYDRIILDTPPTRQALDFPRPIRSCRWTPPTPASPAGSARACGCLHGWGSGTRAVSPGCATSSAGTSGWWIFPFWPSRRPISGRSRRSARRSTGVWQPHPPGEAAGCKSHRPFMGPSLSTLYYSGALTQRGIVAARQSRGREVAMVRLIRRYGGGSRKLYDTEESRYVSLEELGDWIRQGQELRVVDSKTEEDVTAQTLAQIIYESERHGSSMLSSAFFHEVIRRGERVLSSGVEGFQQGLDGLIRTSAKRLPPVRRARNEIDLLRQGLAALDRSLSHLERPGGRPGRTQRHSRPGGSAARAPRRRAHS